MDAISFAYFHGARQPVFAPNSDLHGYSLMSFLLRLSRSMDRVSDAAGFIAKWLVLLSCLISAGNATIRYLLSYSSNGWLEIQWYMFGGIVLLGAAQTLRLNEHVRVDIHYATVSDKTRIWIDIIGFTIFMLPVMAYLTGITWPFFWNSFISSEISMNAGGLIVWPVRGLLPLGFGLLFLQGLAELIKRIAAICGILTIQTDYQAPLQ
jgi:TRAP-type mannitol/chloroaromatic compound transport system permease small subunit